VPVDDCDVVVEGLLDGVDVRLVVENRRDEHVSRREVLDGRLDDVDLFGDAALLARSRDAAGPSEDVERVVEPDGHRDEKRIVDVLDDEHRLPLGVARSRFSLRPVPLWRRDHRMARELEVVRAPVFHLLAAVAAVAAVFLLVDAELAASQSDRRADRSELFHEVPTGDALPDFYRYLAVF